MNDIDIDIDVPQSSCLKILQPESGLNIVQYKISVEGHVVSEHCYGKTFSGPTSISQESRLSLGPTGLARGWRHKVYKSACPQKLREIHFMDSEKYMRQNLYKKNSLNHMILAEGDTSFTKVSFSTVCCHAAKFGFANNLSLDQL